MSPALMYLCDFGSKQMFSSKNQDKKFCLNKQHPIHKSRAIYSFRPSYILMNETPIRKVCLIMSTKVSIYLFSRLANLQASINCDPQGMVDYFYERNFFALILLKSVKYIALF